MDRTYIESQHIVARYLSGDLTVREARQFEKYCLENPEWLNGQPIPVRLKARMTRKPGEEVDPNDFANMPSNAAIEAAQLDEDDDDDDVATGFGALQPTARRWIIALSVMLVLALGGVAAAILYAQSLNKQVTVAQKNVKDYRMRAPGSVHEYRVKVTESKPASPTINLGWPDSPQLMELHVDMKEERFSSFLITVTNVSEGHLMQFRRVARDTNSEVRLNLNSSAFGPGEYDLKFEGYTWRGDTVPVGWIRIGLK